MIGGCGADFCGTTDASAYDADTDTDTWSAIAAYPEPIAWQACGTVDDRLYCAGGLGSSNNDVAHTYVYDPSSDGWSQLADMPATQWGSTYTAANGRLLLAGGVSNSALTNRSQAFDPKTGAWSALPNPSVPTYRGGGAPGFYKIGGGVAPSAPTPKAELLPGYDQSGPGDVTWLSENTQQLSLEPGASATVAVSLDASVDEVTQPGELIAGLTVGTGTPYSVPRVPVSLHVNPPKTWGKITGTVLGATSSGGTAPLAGATVQIDSWASTYTLTTAADGTYALWLDARNNPLTVIVAKDGYQPTVTTVKIQKGATVTSNFTQGAVERVPSGAVQPRRRRALGTTWARRVGRSTWTGPPDFARADARRGSHRTRSSVHTFTLPEILHRQLELCTTELLARFLMSPRDTWPGAADQGAAPRP
ncbi:kelch repeat-containing protein [Streptomyces sp900116325]|uniref:kelch repeat-containing protein n=1 Tax=Streptomyces sp. 900116325 TaxID=3154295 RepID=UPI00331F5D0F